MDSEWVGGLWNVAGVVVVVEIRGGWCMSVMVVMEGRDEW